jgi:acyl carrier protein
MRSKEEIFNYLKDVLVELFEIDPAKITHEAHLYRDLDIDSIDAVDLVLKLKEVTGRKIQPDDFRHVRTVDDVVNAVHTLLLDAAPAS